MTLKGTLQTLGVMTVSVSITTLTLFAVDTVNLNDSGGLRAFVGGALKDTPPCDRGMVFISTDDDGFCIDIYEASPSKKCLHNNPENQSDTHINLTVNGCMPVSEVGRIPWSFISQNQAEQACAKAGKRLPTPKEWYRASLGTPDYSEQYTPRDCNLASNWGEDTSGLSGTGARCVSSSGAYDMVGNVWEWVSGTINKGQYGELTLPPAGHVSSVNEEGFPLTTEGSPVVEYFHDRFWIDESIVVGIFRGGYWKSKKDGGIYALHAEVPPSFVGAGVGFRCVASVVQ